MKRLDLTANQLLAERSALRANGCLEWTGPKNGNGPYGYVPQRFGSSLAHRLAYQQGVGEIPPGMLVCHKCDNPLCILVDHLFLGTAKDNMVDMVKKNRHRPPSLRGERSPNCKFSDQTISEIRSRARAGISLPAIAAEFGMDRKYCGQIIRGEARNV